MFAYVSDGSRCVTAQPGYRERVTDRQLAPPAPDPRSPVERRVEDSLTDREGVGRPLSRRARQTRRSVEAYLAAGVLPRYMLRLREIDEELSFQRHLLRRAYHALARRCGDDTALFARRWRARAESWRLDRVNDLIREHNEWYPVEARLALDPRTGDYVRLRGRSYRRAEVGPDWVLEQFPAMR
jgi:hypothetical protein